MAARQTTGNGGRGRKRKIDGAHERALFFPEKKPPLEVRSQKQKHTFYTANFFIVSVVIVHISSVILVDPAMMSSAIPLPLSAAPASSATAWAKAEEEKDRRRSVRSSRSGRRRTKEIEDAMLDLLCSLTSVDKIKPCFSGGV